MRDDSGLDADDVASIADAPVGEGDRAQPGLAELLLDARNPAAVLPPEKLREVVDRILTSGEFCRDTEAGSLLHPRGKIAFRQLTRHNSLHVSIGEDDISVHIDRLSPLARRQEDVEHCGHCNYSVARVVMHMVINLSGALRRPKGRASGAERMDISMNAGPDWRGATGPTPANPGLGDPACSAVVAFSAMDESVFLLDSPVEPWTVQIEGRLNGRLDIARLRGALQDALGRHPMTRARKAKPVRGRRQLVWEITEQAQVDPLRVVDCPSEQELARLRDDFYSLSVPLSVSPPLRVVLARLPDADVVMLAVHHAALDAIGGLRWLRSVANFYAGTEDGSDVPAGPARPDLNHLLRPRTPAQGARRVLSAAAAVWAFSRGSSHIAGRDGRNLSGYGIAQLELGEELSATLHGQGQHLEEVLVCGLHLALASWNDEQGNPAHRLTVGWPVNLRPASWRQDVAGNFVCMVPVVTLPEDRRDRQGLAAVVARQMQPRRLAGSAAAVVGLLGVLRRIVPLALKPAVVERVTGNPFAPSAVLHNLGSADAIDFGPDAGCLFQVWFSPPAMMPEALSIGVVTHGDRIRLALRYRLALWGADEASQFSNHYLAALNSALSRPAH